MIVEISWGSIAAGLGVAGTLGEALRRFVNREIASCEKAVADLKQQHEDDVNKLRESVKTLFGKHDAVVKELNDYKLHVAETYVNQAALEKMLQPMERRLERIEESLSK